MSESRPPAHARRAAESGQETDIALRRRVAARLQWLCAQAAERLQAAGVTPLPTPGVRYFDHRLEAGRAMAAGRRGQAGVLELNSVYLRSHTEEMLEETVAHELAHLVVFHLHPRRQPPPHGALWQEIMRAWFGVEPQRTHAFDTQAVAARRQRRWRYVCACGEHEVSTVRHRRMQQGTLYCCRHCRQPLAPMVQQELFG